MTKNCKHDLKHISFFDLTHISLKILSGSWFSKDLFLKFYLMRVLWAFKGPVRGIGAPTPIFEPYISSYNHIFDLNATKLHFLYSTKLVG